MHGSARLPKQVRYREAAGGFAVERAIPSSCWVQDEGGPTKTVTSDETYPLITVASRESTSRSR